MSQTTKSRFGGFKRSIDMHSLSNLNLASSSLLTNIGKINLNANNEISIISSNINSASTINLNALNTISILAAKEQSKEVNIHKKSSFNPLGILTYIGTLGLGGGEIYKSSLNEKGSSEGIAKLSNIAAIDTINLNTNDTLITANLSSNDDININANKVTILNTKNDHSQYSISKKTSISLAHIGDILKDITKTVDNLKKDTSIKLHLANTTYEKATKNVSSAKSVSSTLNSKNLNINTNDDITITGSTLNASDDLTLSSKNGNIYISNSSDTIDTAATLKQANAALSLTIQNEYAQIVPAALALKEAVAQLKRVKKEYDNYKKRKIKARS